MKSKKRSVLVHIFNVSLHEFIFFFSHFFLKLEKIEPEKTKVQKMFKELSALYGPPKLRRMALICYYTWCVTALSYYVTGEIDVKSFK